MIKKGRKPKGKHNKLILDSALLENLVKRKKNNHQTKAKNPEATLDQHEISNLDSLNMIEETNSILTCENNYKRCNERGDRTPDRAYSEVSGPITRRKENQILNVSNLKANDVVTNLSSLKTFDLFYKDVKNIDNEMYQYHPPRVSYSFQVDLTLIDNIENRNITPKYDFSRITKEDLGYFLKFVNYYKNILDSNVMLKGVSNFEESALDLLMQCEYDINLTLKKILFPSFDLIGDCAYSKMKKSDEELMIYVNSALNDLIGSNIHEKEKWLDHVREKIDNTISFDELQVLIELANKMKIDIPDFVLDEIENSINFTKTVRRHLNEKNSLKDINRLLEESKNYKVKTEECYILEDIIVRALNWGNKATEIEHISVNYKILQTVYNEGRNLPVKLPNFDKIKTRYIKAQTWQDKFISLPKHSKTRQTNVQQERCTIAYLADMIREAEEINFTSNEVASLKNNFNKLREVESRICMALEDELIPVTKDNLSEFIHILDGLKFATDLYETISTNIEYYKWIDKRDYYMSNKVLKIKHLRNLTKDATQKNLYSISEVRAFKSACDVIEEWLDKMSNIFYKEEESKNNNNKIDLRDIYSCYEIGKTFELQLEEVEHLLIKCEEIFDFVKECKAANNSQAYDFQKLNTLREQILKYNIKCEEFDMIDKQINMVQSWIESYEDIFQKITKARQTIFRFRQLNSIEIRQEVVEMLEQFLRTNQTFMENLNDIISKVPHFAKCSKEYNQLLTEQANDEKFMSKFSPEKMELELLQVFMNEARGKFVKKSFFAQLLCIYRAKSWSYIASITKQMSLSEADILIKEAHNLNLNTFEVETIKSQIFKTKEWIKQWKKISNADNICYKNLKVFIDEGSSLPLHTDELEELFVFQASLENDIFQARSFLQKKTDYEEFNEFANKVKQFSIIVPEFEIILNLKSLCDDWKIIVDRTISSRKLCLLYFKKDSNNILYNKFEDSYKIMSEENDDLFKHGSCSHSSDEYSKQKVDSNMLKNTNELVILDNILLFDNESSKNISKKKYKKASKKEYDNVLNIINSSYAKKEPIDHPSPKKKILSEFDKVNLKKFNSFSYEEKLEIISKTVLLKSEAEDEKYCICRRGDDSVNYMIMCECCKEWFHGKCLKIPKNTADRISQYLCLACSRRKDIYNTSYHYDFLNNRRISYDKFMSIIEEGISLPVYMSEIEILNNHFKKIAEWEVRYEETIKAVLSIMEKNSIKCKMVLYDDQLEKKLIDLYLESEGFFVEKENAFNLILILKHQDWLKDAFKCFENRKFSEKLNKKVLTLYHTLFNSDNFHSANSTDKYYFDKITDKAKYLYNDTLSNYEKYSSAVSIYKKEPKRLEDHVVVTPELTNELKKEIENYNEWKQLLFESLNQDMTDDRFREFEATSKTFKLQTSFLEKFRLIALNYKKENISHYRLVLFENENPKKKEKSTTINKIKSK